MKEGTEDMNDIWSILEIKATDDKKAIRKAFAAQSGFTIRRKNRNILRR